MKRIFISFCLGLACSSGCFANFAPVVPLSLTPKKAPKHYYVKPGDTLYSIAWTYGLDHHELAKMNRLSDKYQIWAGQELILRRFSKHAYHKKAAAHFHRFSSVKGWAWPAKGEIIHRFNPVPLGNAGIDIRGYLGQSIHAANTGSVVYSGNGVRGYGNLIIIKNGADYLSAYAFNQRNLVRVGSRVRKGQTIAQMGRNTLGIAVLHFEIRRAGHPVNPLSYLKPT